MTYLTETNSKPSWEGLPSPNILNYGNNSTKTGTYHDDVNNWTTSLQMSLGDKSHTIILGSLPLGYTTSSMVAMAMVARVALPKQKKIQLQGALLDISERIRRAANSIQQSLTEFI